MLAVVYLIFNEGYNGRGDLAGEAIRLGRLLTHLLPSQPEAHGLLALRLCHDARRRARYAGNELVLLADQDRALWDLGQIEGLPLEEYPYLHPTRADLLRRLGRIDAAAQSSVRLQWDPDHHPSGAKLERRAIQLGLRGPMLEHYANEWIVDIEDLSDFVADQRQHVQAGRYEHLVTPREEVLVQQHRCPRLSRPK